MSQFFQNKKRKYNSIAINAPLDEVEKKFKNNINKFNFFFDADYVLQYIRKIFYKHGPEYLRWMITTPRMFYFEIQIDFFDKEERIIIKELICDRERYLKIAYPKSIPTKVIIFGVKDLNYIMSTSMINFDWCDSYIKNFHLSLNTIPVSPAYKKLFLFPESKNKILLLLSKVHNKYGNNVFLWLNSIYLGYIDKKLEPFKWLYLNNSIPEEELLIELNQIKRKLQRLLKKYNYLDEDQCIKKKHIKNIRKIDYTNDEYFLFLIDVYKKYDTETCLFLYILCYKHPWSKECFCSFNIIQKFWLKKKCKSTTCIFNRGCSNVIEYYENFFSKKSFCKNCVNKN